MISKKNMEILVEVGRYILATFGILVVIALCLLFCIFLWIGLQRVLLKLIMYIKSNI